MVSWKTKHMDMLYIINHAYCNAPPSEAFRLSMLNSLPPEWNAWCMEHTLGRGLWCGHLRWQSPRGGKMNILNEKKFSAHNKF
jgi:hypothetical protein